MIDGRRALALLALAAACTSPGRAQSPPAPPPEAPPGAPAPAPEPQVRRSEETLPPPVFVLGPRRLVAPTGARLGGEFAKGELPSRDAAPAERQAAAVRWLDEALAPLGTPACAAVLQQLGYAPAGPPPALPLLLPADRPLASAPDGKELLLPAGLELPTPDDMAQFRATGLIPFEVALGGEYARSIGARHAGPAPSDALMRATRAARLEGVARLGGLVLALRGAGVDPGELGASALTADHDGAGVPWPLGVKLASDPVRRALLRTYFEDGLRWALFHYLRGALAGVAAALERPAAEPESLLRPGVSRRPPPAPAGCRLGPRGVLAVIAKKDDAEWIGSLVGDSTTSTPAGLDVWLAFEDAGSAERARTDLGRSDIASQQDGAVLKVHLAIHR